MNMTILFGTMPFVTCFSDERTVDPDSIGEGVEQPHRSKRVKVSEPEARFFSIKL